MAGQTVLVTGSSRGLGRRVVETLARRQHTVFASMRGAEGKNAESAAELRALAEREGLRIHAVELDVSDEASIQTAVQRVLEAAGHIDVVIHNAGFGLMGPTEACSMEQIRSLFEANVFGVLRLNQAVLPHMRRRGSGLLMYMASTSAHIFYPFLGAYSGTKAALEAIAHTVHYEVFSLGIDTVILQLGTYATDFGTNYQQATRDEAWDDYGATGETGRAFLARIVDYMAKASDPQEAAEMVAKLIDTPAGQRPLRVATGMGSEGLLKINEASEAIHSQILSPVGLDSLLTRKGEDK
jgi:NAD(P)-dependent dehydrogenase (short-subunit alcohol dehydrogenase family)